MEKCYIAGDVESSRGAVLPPEANMVSFALCEVGNPQEFFYVELRPVYPQPWDVQTERIHLITLKYALAHGKNPRQSMQDAAQWVRRTAAGRVPVFCAMPIWFDHGYLDWYFRRYLVRNPFTEVLDGRDQYRAIQGLSSGARVDRAAIWRDFPTSLPHTHHALSDTFEYEEVVAGMLRAQGLL